MNISELKPHHRHPPEFYLQKSNLDDVLNSIYEDIKFELANDTFTLKYEWNFSKLKNISKKTKIFQVNSELLPIIVKILRLQGYFVKIKKDNDYTRLITIKF